MVSRMREAQAIFLIKWKLRHSKFRWLKRLMWDTAIDFEEMCKVLCDPLLSDLSDAISFCVTKDNLA